MYRKILVAVENSKADRTLLPHIATLARALDSALLLVHVADGWAARHYERLNLVESEEIKADRAYLEQAAAGLREKGIMVEVKLAMGEPATEIIKAADAGQCDLIAMGSHGHRLIGDLVLGSTIHHVRHKTDIPILLVRAR
jgi:nucleotide-binding universal stress UspA family protein